MLDLSIFKDVRIPGLAPPRDAEHHDRQDIGDGSGNGQPLVAGAGNENQSIEIDAEGCGRLDAKLGNPDNAAPGTGSGRTGEEGEQQRRRGL